MRENAPDIGQDPKCFFISASVIRSLRFDTIHTSSDDIHQSSSSSQLLMYQLDEGELLKTIVDDNIVDD